MRSMKNALSRSWTTCYSRGELQVIEVQVLVRSGIPRLDIIGLPQNMIREGKDRILSTLTALGIELPTQKILVSLNPGDLQKEGSHFDLPILVGILTALGLLLPTEGRKFYWGELGLDGSIHKMDDVLAHLLFANQFHPEALVSGGRKHSLDFISPHLHRPAEVITDAAELLEPSLLNQENSKIKNHERQQITDTSILDRWKSESIETSRWNSLLGSEEQFLFWALVALGRHHILLEGSPGVGKSSWCFALRELQLPLSSKTWSDRFRFQANSSSQMKELVDLFRAPFECPHHSSSSPAIVGGGSGCIQVGAITRAHRGILFLDEFAEFSTDVLESLREPLESKTVTIARSGSIQTLSADIQLVAAMNPCRCGNYGSKQLCTCTTNQFYKYRTKVSGPLKDRFHATCWWEFNIDTPTSEYRLDEIRRRLIGAHSTPEPIFGKIELPEFQNPRRQRKWLEFFSTWCRWFGLLSPNQNDLTQFCNFLNQMENPYENSEYGRISSNTRAGAREFGTSNS